MADFTFLRPLWLLALPLLAVLWWLLRRRTMARQIGFPQIAPHLLAALTIGSRQTQRSYAALLVLGAAGLMVVGVAGPAFRPAPSPFLQETAPLVIALDVSAGMENPDIAPSRLERGKQKIRDLIDLRAGGRIGLIAYSGSAHLVMPPTEDPTVLLPFLEALEPGIMPRAGQRPSEAMKLAETLIADEENPGSVLFITDGIDPDDIDRFPTGGAARVALIVAPDGGGSEVNRWASAADIRTVDTTVDSGDLRAVNHAISSSLARAAGLSGKMQDDGWILAIPATLLILLWFRRGTTLYWMLLLGVMAIPPRADAGPLADLFWTPDQQGSRAYAERDFGQAATLFADPQWQAVAMMRDGQYMEAAALLEPVQTRDAQFNRGVALIRGRDYQGAVNAFSAALTLDPLDAEAQENLDLARRIIAYLTDARQGDKEQIDNADNAPDDTVEDQAGNQGQTTQITEETGLSEDAAAQWMEQVQTKPADFLKSRFLVENAANSEGVE
ncbi:VWA domain-containing protein [Falsirhodobacter sp. alg1]|uniref:VWA domain-containing protein n=1 Tax=Falsirhodobacter sp. alg1 TaxID=1472418 RepID=UPI000786D118|nr:VWA domain-containing protein [Falsirhodobacter sp. alg1]